MSAANDRLSGYEKEFQNNLETTPTDIAAKAPTDLAASYSTDYMAAYGDEYTISTVPAFTKAADGQTVAERKDTETENPQTQNAPRPVRPDRAEDLNRFATRSIFLQRKAARSVLAVKGFTSAKPAPLTGGGPI